MSGPTSRWANSSASMRQTKTEIFHIRAADWVCIATLQTRGGQRRRNVVWSGKVAECPGLGYVEDDDGPGVGPGRHTG